AFAIAHIRGGSEMGRAWYENGRQLQKKNTFNDFVDVADDLVRRGYTSPDRLFPRGASAGGLLMGAVVNMRPELFKGVIAGVPYVDVITTMMDSTIPLTTGEYDEWGNPHDSTFYRYMLSYSPYDNVERKAYPNLLITAGLYDTQVLYVEPAKWTAKLRAMKTGSNRLILRTNMEAGHGGASGRYKRWRDVAFEYAFLLDLAGLGEKTRPQSPRRFGLGLRFGCRIGPLGKGDEGRRTGFALPFPRPPSPFPFFIAPCLSARPKRRRCS